MGYELQALLEVIIVQMLFIYALVIGAGIVGICWFVKKTVKKTVDEIKETIQKELID